MTGERLNTDPRRDIARGGARHNNAGRRLQTVRCITATIS